MRFLDTRHTWCCVPQLPLRDVTCDVSYITFFEVPPAPRFAEQHTDPVCFWCSGRKKSGLCERECTPLESVPDSLANVLGRWCIGTSILRALLPPLLLLVGVGGDKVPGHPAYVVLCSSIPPAWRHMWCLLHHVFRGASSTSLRRAAHWPRVLLVFWPKRVGAARRIYIYIYTHRCIYRHRARCEVNMLARVARPDAESQTCVRRVTSPGFQYITVQCVHVSTWYACYTDIVYRYRYIHAWLSLSPPWSITLMNQSSQGPLQCAQLHSWSSGNLADTANLRTTILDSRGLDSSIISVLRGGSLRSPESLSQGISAGTILVGRPGARLDGDARRRRCGSARTTRRPPWTCSSTVVRPAGRS